MPGEETKTCTKCGAVKPLEDFRLVRKRNGREYHRGACDPCRLAAMATYNASRMADREAWNSYNRQRYAATRDQVLARMCAKRAGDPRFRERDLAYYYRHREQRVAAQEKHNLKRRARLAGVPHEPWVRAEIFERDGGVCQLCGVDLTNAPYHIDHIVLISRGGADMPANLRLLCPPCNQRRPKSQ